MHTVKAIYPGTFDPLTNGHLDLIARAAKIVDQLVIAILKNSEKTTPLFTVAERETMISEATSHFGNVSVAVFDGLLVDFARQQGAKAVLRGIRAISDYEYELQMAMMNRKLDPELETLFMMPARNTPTSAPASSRVSSSSAATSPRSFRRPSSSGSRERYADGRSSKQRSVRDAFPGTDHSARGSSTLSVHLRHGRSCSGRQAWLTQRRFLQPRGSQTSEI